MKVSLPNGQWILMGDYNMIESPLDSSSPAPLLNGRQREVWHLLSTCLDLVDTFSIPWQFWGTRFTRQVVHGLKMDQSCTDHFYINEQGHWIHAVHTLEHVQKKSLSDHNPIVLTIQISLANAPHTLKKSIFFKANPTILKQEKARITLRQSWQTHFDPPLDPTRKFSLAWERLRSTYPSLQNDAKKAEIPSEYLQLQLAQLKLDILEDSQAHQHKEFQDIRDQLMEA